MDSETTTEAALHPPFLSRLRRSIQRQFQQQLDSSVPYTALRWLSLLVLVFIFSIRVYLLQGFYIVTYGLGIFLLNLFIGFLTPLEDLDSDGPILPSNEGDEFKPFVRRLPEFKFWYSCFRALLVALTMTFFNIFNVPVFWPILLVYFIVLFILTLKRQIEHMKKHGYCPWSAGKPKYTKQNQDFRVNQEPAAATAQ